MMTPSTDAEVTALWTAIFGEPPAVTATASEMLAILVPHLDNCRPYHPFEGRLDLVRPVDQSRADAESA